MVNSCVSTTISSTNIGFAPVQKIKTTCVLMSFKFGGHTTAYENPLSVDVKYVNESAIFKSYAKSVKSMLLNNLPFAIKNNISSVNYSLGAGCANISVVCKCSLSAVNSVIKTALKNASKAAIKKNYSFYAQGITKISASQIDELINSLLSFNSLSIAIIGNMKNIDKKVLDAKLKNSLTDVCSKSGSLPMLKDLMNTACEVSSIAKKKKYAIFPECGTYTTSGDVGDSTDNDNKKKIAANLKVMSKRFGDNIVAYSCAVSCLANATSVLSECS